MVYKKRKTDIVSLIKRMLDLILLFEVENIFLLRMRSHESRKKNTRAVVSHQSLQIKRGTCLYNLYLEIVRATFKINLLDVYKYKRRYSF